MNVEIFADVVCPWCYLGQARFRRAVADFGHEVQVTWRPFQLDPGALSAAVPATAHLAEKFGGLDRVTEAHARLRGLASAEGLAYEPERGLHVNTGAAHRVIWLAGREGGPALQDAVAERLFRAQHAEGRDVGDAETLAELAGSAGLAAGSVRAMLASGEGVAELEQDLARARELGVTGVPYFLFEGKWGVSGAQPAQTLEAALHEVAGNLTR
ncbi:DsbA family oxidoreductase [Actinomadura scrupuli]|uniref:DsbA family oxidoreductase n=1 Tax=Actinomadura scrupuli TaxID=559629 RepID=UPI003D96C899